MNLKINPITSSLNGEIIAPGSKSYSHRAFIAASLADGISIIKNPLKSGDVEVTMNVLKTLGVKILEKSDNTYIIKSGKESFRSYKKTLDCGNSGTTIRIFSALSLLFKDGLSLSGEFFKLNRPILPLLKSLEQIGAVFKLSGGKLKIKRKKILCNKIKIQGNKSSQFITALLMLCPQLQCENKDFFEIELTTPLVSKPFIEITLDVLETFGINIQANFEIGKFYITNDQTYRSQSFTIPGDFSSAAFIIAAAVLSKKPSSIIINNLSIKNSQGDKKIIEILREMGANINMDEDKNQIIVNGDIKKYPLKGIEINCKDIPDLFPILSVIGAFAEGKTVLYNASNLRLKETDRISTIARELSNMGIKIIEEDDKLTIFHCDKIKGTTINHNNDHRIAMACSIAALYADSSSYIQNSEIIKDSYPSFFGDLKELGAQIEQV
ncbi:MAG: 3-phosphoshikimate 1-carboxyvinyltransferase [Candidatus Lokiarchaeota archaeon]|nr:3-phosphoshikimate 1-carboxyvinyltransferase [Candidatus Lokiarchaeota archaeon]MCK4479577.1 3-phosphoshikimate 1-carboxyvinyltransferase [Candidatus Lokiarchaeota archaeon]